QRCWISLARNACRCPAVSKNQPPVTQSPVPPHDTGPAADWLRLAIPSISWALAQLPPDSTSTSACRSRWFPESGEVLPETAQSPGAAHDMSVIAASPAALISAEPGRVCAKKDPLGFLAASNTCWFPFLSW